MSASAVLQAEHTSRFLIGADYANAQTTLKRKARVGALARVCVNMEEKQRRWRSNLVRRCKGGCQR